jgi:putative peptidoglycan lipid II flippase
MPDQNAEQSKGVNTTTSGAQVSQIIKNALKMAFGTMTSRVLGLLRESLLAALFDKSITDAFNAAFRIPNLFRRLLGEGSLSVSFIPVFIDAKNDSPERAANLINSFYSLLLILLSVLTTLGVLFSDDFLRLLLSPEFISQTDKMLLTEHMAKIMFLFIFFISSFAFFMGILNSLGEFFWPAIAPTFWNMAMVISTIWPQRWLPESYAKYGDQLAWGVVVGGLFQVGVLVPSLIKRGYLPKPDFRFKKLFTNPDAFRVFRNMVPGLIGMGLLQLNTVINLRFSSQFSEGTVSFINYVDRLIELPLSLISVSLGTALLPMLSNLWNQKDFESFSKTTQRSLELNIYLSIFAAFGVYALATPIVNLLFGHGKFTAANVLTTAEILKTYCWIMIFSSGVRVLTPAYFAVKNTWFPATVSGLCVIVHISLAPVLMKQYMVHGLMMSTIVSATLNFLLLLIFFPVFVTRFEYVKFLKTVLLYTGAGVVIFLIASNYQWMADIYGTSHITQALVLFFVILMCLFAFLVISYILRVEEIMVVLKKIRSQFRKREVITKE